jgi:hypothetical protein
MGINRDEFYAMLYAAKREVNFTKTLTIGRLTAYINKNDFTAALSVFDPFGSWKTMIKSMYAPLYENRSTAFLPYSEPLFEYLGAETVDSLDFSDYEGATIIHDMNKPAPETLKNKYTLVWDGGALEHIFNFPIAVKNCMDMTAVDGHFVSVTCGNNYFGHGLYQFSPELFFSLLSEKNGFSNTMILMPDDKRNWYMARSPQELGLRVEVCPSVRRKCPLVIISRKTGHVPEVLDVMQSDYVSAWIRDDRRTSVSQKTSVLHNFIQTALPPLILVKLRWILQRWIRTRHMQRFYTPISDFYNPKKRVDL